MAALLAVARWYYDIPHGPVEVVLSLHGKTDGAIFDQLGEPDIDYEFTMDQIVCGFRRKLLNSYPPNSKIVIRECTWKYSRYQLTVWFHKLDSDWIALNSCRYQNGVVFCP